MVKLEQVYLFLSPMKKSLLFLFILFGFLTLTYSQDKKISVEDIYRGEFRTEGLDVLRSLKNGKQYTILNLDRSAGTSSIDKYDYATLEKVGSIVSSADLPEIDAFSSYEFSEDESKILLATEVEPIFRRSTLGRYYVYDIGNKALTLISEVKVREPALSPDGKKVAYVANNNLYLFDIASQKTKQISSDGEKNRIINGVTDWVYEEEFAFVRAFAWNSDGSQIAFLRFDETEVPEFSMDIFGTDLYPSQETFKYPKAGSTNSTVTLHLFDMASGNISKIDLGNPDYIPRIQWMNHPHRLSVQTLNRHQNDLRLQAVNTEENTVTTLLEEKDAAYVDVTDDLTFLTDDRFIWTSERDGHNHIYLYDQEGTLINQITKGPWAVTHYYGYDQKRDQVYYQSTENGSINRGVYSIDSSGKNKKALAAEEGTNSADFQFRFHLFYQYFFKCDDPSDLHLAQGFERQAAQGDHQQCRLACQIGSIRIQSERIFDP